MLLVVNSTLVEWCRRCIAEWNLQCILVHDSLHNWLLGHALYTVERIDKHVWLVQLYYNIICVTPIVKLHYWWDWLLFYLCHSTRMLHRHLFGSQPDIQTVNIIISMQVSWPRTLLVAINACSAEYLASPSQYVGCSSQHDPMLIWINLLDWILENLGRRLSGLSFQ